MKLIMEVFLVFLTISITILILLIINYIAWYIVVYLIYLNEKRKGKITGKFRDLDFDRMKEKDFA